MRRLLLTLLLVSCSHNKQSVSLYESGDYAGAARAADEGLVSHPDDDGLWAMRVRAALALGDADGVAKTYERYAARRGDDDKDLLRDLSEATLVQALASPSAKLQIVAIQTVEDLEIHELADAVALKMESDDDRVAAAAAIAILHGYAQAPKVADDMLHSENAEARKIAVDGIGKKVGKLALADLEKAGDDHDPRVRRAALTWVGSLKDKDGVELCTRRMKDPDDGVRAAAAAALAKIGIGKLEEAGKKAIADHALAVRLAGIELLAAAHAEPALVSLTDDADPIVATEAAIALKKPDLAAKAVARAVTAEDPVRRAGAANLLVRALGREGALPYAQKLAGDPDPMVRLSAARVLAHAGDKPTAARVFTAALSTDDAVQAAADLAALDDPTGVAALSSLVRDTKRSADARASAAAAHLTAHHVTPGLVAALADPSGLVRVQAAAALGHLAR